MGTAGGSGSVMITSDVLRRVYFRFALRAGYERVLVRRITSERWVVVLNLHSVTPRPNPFWPGIRPQELDSLLSFLRAHFPIRGIRESGPGPAVVLSFDDGYRDFVEYAMPVLEQHGVRANLNIIPECVESGLPMWNVRLYDFLQQAPENLLRKLRVPGWPQHLESGSASAKARYGAGLSKHLKSRSRKEREELWAAIAPVLDCAPAASTAMMTREDVISAAMLHDIGAHSYSHDSMAYETDHHFVEDVQRCDEYFRNTLGLPLDIYAFPNGSYRPAQVAYLQRTGKSRILLVEEKFATGGSSVIPRISTGGHSSAELRFRALGGRTRGVL